MQKMKARKSLFLAGKLAVALISAGPLLGAESTAYAPAFYDPGPGRGDAPKLHVFPIDGQLFTVSLPFQLGKVAVSPDGTILYGSRFFDPAGRNTGLYKVEFGPTRASRLAGSEGFASVYGIAASSTKIAVSAGYLTAAGFLSECGLYELILSSRTVHKIVSNSDCKYLSSWSSISLSPDSRKIVAVRKHRLELIDTETQIVQSLGEGFYDTGWSPDGRWIAALGDNGKHTMLIDASDLDKRRTLPPSEVIWSPDSRSILASRLNLRCPPDFGTLHLIDIESGRTSTIQSSACKVSHLIFGWVNLGEGDSLK